MSTRDTFERELGDWLSDNNLCLTNESTGATIRPYIGDKDWTVQRMYYTDKDYSTLKGAVANAEKETP